MLRRTRIPASVLRHTHASSTTTTPSRLAKLESRLPRFLQRYTQPLRTAPVSHVTAFLLLHELTAVIPLFGLAGAFHYFEWLPPWIAEGRWVKEGMEKMGRYARRKGWVGEGEMEGAEANGKVAGRSGRWWDRSEGGVRIVVELATAWAVTKALLPVRLVFSVWATPWFARTTLLPVWSGVKRLFGSKTKATTVKSVSSPAAGTNAVGGRIGSSGKTN